MTAATARNSTAIRRDKNPRSEPGITRVDQESTRTHGYVVRVGYRRTPRGWRPRFTAFFGDVRHGGAARALAAARKYLKQIQRTGKAPRRA